MKKSMILMAVLFTACTAVNAQSTSQKNKAATKKCVQKKMNNRTTLEKGAAYVVPSLKKVQQGAAKRDCNLERLKSKGNGKSYRRKYSGKASKQ